MGSVSQSVGNLAEKWRVLGLDPSTSKTWKSTGRAGTKSTNAHMGPAITIVFQQSIDHIVTPSLVPCHLPIMHTGEAEQADLCLATLEPVAHSPLTTPDCFKTCTFSDKSYFPK